MSIDPHGQENTKTTNEVLKNFANKIDTVLNELKQLNKKSSPNCLIKDETIKSITNIQTQVAEIQKSIASLQSQSLSDLDTKVQEISDCIGALDIHTTSDAVNESCNEIRQKLDEVINSIEGQLDDINENMATQSSVVELWENNHGLNDIFKRVNEIKNLLDKIDISSFQYKISDSVNELEKLVSKLQGSVGLTSDEYSASSSANVKAIKEHITDKVTSAIKPVSDKIASIFSKLSEIKNAVEEIQKNTKPSGSSVVYTSLKPEHKTYFTWTAVFAIALVLSAIFITRGYLVFFSNHTLLTAALAFFCISFGVICTFNLVFSIKNIDVYKKVIRFAYIISCGIVIGVTIALSIAVLVI